jgi:Asp-tRNA(Asn)/Glu-tRNA(Gln) amidotransferase A subunit family amidase
VPADALKLGIKGNSYLVSGCLLGVVRTAPEGRVLPLVKNPTSEEFFSSGHRYHWNICPFNMTGHPAINVPCAKSKGLPIGMMLVRRHLEDASVLRVAHAFQALGLYQ